MLTLALETPYTVSSIVGEVLDVLHSYTRDQDQHTSLATAITDTATSFTVNDSKLLSRGLVEIEDELVYASSVDSTNGAATIEPWGRGQSGSTAVAHSANARVTMAPLYPRIRVANVIAGVLREVFPRVFAVDETNLDITLAQTNYVLPTDAYQVLSVEWNLPGPSGMWAPVQRWRQNKPLAGVELEILSPVFPGSNQVRVKYMKRPPTEWSMADDLGTTYGYDHEIRDLIVLGAVARSLAYTGPSRLQVSSMEAHGRSADVPAEALDRLARSFYAQFRQRLEDERMQILLRHPIQPHRSA